MAEKMKALWKGKYQEAEDGSRIPEEYLPGVPARSLTEEEYDQLDEELRDAVRRCGLYDVRTEREMSARSPQKEG